jgi:putative ABC transport system permease protein
MGKVLLVGRLAIRDIRGRPAQAILLLLAIAAGTATLTLGLALQGTTSNPYARTRAAAMGPDIVAVVSPNGDNVPGPATSAGPGGAGSAGGPSGPGSAAARGLLALEHAPGVTAYSGPIPVRWALIKMGHTTAGAEIEGRSTERSAVDRPKVTQGTWVRPGGVVVEAAFADQLGLHVGDRLRLGGRPFEVVGTAVTAGIPDYPGVCVHFGCFLAGLLASYNPGLVWATQADAQLIGGPGAPVGYYLNLKLSDPAGATAFADRYDASAAPTAPYLYPWTSIRDGDAETIAKVQKVLLTGSWLLALLALASVVVLVGGRMAEQTRRVGLLKAVGGTPGLVAAVLLCEHVLVGLCAAGAGLIAGWLTAPVLDAPGAGLIGAPSAPSLSAATVGLVVALAVALATVATFVPAIRAARQSTVAALDDSARAPRRLAMVIDLSAHLPATLLLGVRLAVRRPRRLLLSVFSIAVTASGLMTVLTVHAGDSYRFLGPKVAEVLTIISVMLVILAAVNAIVIGWATALDARHSAALARALGATPDQITTGLSVAQLLPALAGVLLGIPGGIAIYDLGRHGAGTTTIPPALWLATMVVVTLLAVAVLTAIPARVGARRAVAEVLQAEAA